MKNDHFFKEYPVSKTRWWNILKDGYIALKVHGLPNILVYETCICGCVECIYSYSKDSNTVFTDNDAISDRPAREVELISKNAGHFQLITAYSQNCINNY